MHTPLCDRKFTTPIVVIPGGGANGAFLSPLVTGLQINPLGVGDIKPPRGIMMMARASPSVRVYFDTESGLFATAIPSDGQPTLYVCSAKIKKISYSWDTSGAPDTLADFFQWWLIDDVSSYLTAFEAYQG